METHSDTILILVFFVCSRYLNTYGTLYHAEPQSSSVPSAKIQSFNTHSAPGGDMR